MVIVVSRRHKRIFFWLLGLLILLALAALADYLFYRDRIYPGVQLKDLDLGRMRAAEARESLQNLSMGFSGPEAETLEVPLRELGITLAVEEILEEALCRGREHLPPHAYWERLKLKHDGAYLVPVYNLDNELLRQKLDTLEQNFNRQPIDAFPRVDDAGKMVIVPDKPGYRVVKSELLKELLRSLEEPRSPLVTAVPCEQIVPDVTERNLRNRGITALIGSFTTSFDASNSDRAHNLALAASVLDSRIFAPGEIVSVNGIVGDTTPEKGYRKAPIMTGDNLVPGYGGGICQISSTLYNAALLGGLEIIERHNHAMTVDYVNPGRDATIDYGSKDMKFRNNTPGSIMIRASIIDYELTFFIFGTPPNYRVEIETTELAVYPPPEKYIYDPELPAGTIEVDEGRPGYMVEVWKITRREDEIVAREKISVNYYRPYPEVVRFGPQPDD